MIPRYLLFFCLLLHGYQGLVNATTTSFTFYTDGSCQNSAVNVQTSTQAGNGDCGAINGYQSVNLIEIAPGCSLTIYSDDGCSDNATAVSFGSCITMTAKTYSVDCPQNGVLDGYTTILAVSSQPSRSPPSSSIFASSTTQPQQGLTSQTYPSGPGSITSSSSDQSTSSSVTSRSSSSTTSLSIETPTSSSTNQHLSESAAASATPAPSTSKIQKESGNDGGWSKEATIIIAVVLCIFFGSLLAAMLFFVVRRPKPPEPPKPWELSSGDINGFDLGRGVRSELAVWSRDNHDLAPSAPQVHPVELDS